MGGRGSSSKSGKGGTFEPNPTGGGGGKGTPDKETLGPRIPETLNEALGKKGRPMGITRAAGGTNPHYSPAYDAYSSNCQRCVLTYEARRRGYDVTALPTYKGDLLPSGGDYLKALSNPTTVKTGKSVKNVEREMKSYGPGSRAIISVGKGYNGHVFIAENVGGKISYVDPQTNTQYSSLSFNKISSSSVTRIDNQQFTEYARNAFTRQKV